MIDHKFFFQILKVGVMQGFVQNFAYIGRQGLPFLASDMVNKQWWGGSFANHEFSLNFVLCTWIRQEHLIWPEMWLYKMVEDPSNWKIGLESIFCKKCVWQLKRKVCLAIGLVMHHRGGAVFSKRENTAEHGNNEINTDHFDFIRIIIVILKI